MLQETLIYFACGSSLSVLPFITAPFIDEFSLTKSEYAFYIVSLPGLISGVLPFLISFFIFSKENEARHRFISVGSIAIVITSTFGMSLSRSLLQASLSRIFLLSNLYVLQMLSFTRVAANNPNKKEAKGIAVFLAGCLGMLFLTILDQFIAVSWRNFLLVSLSPMILPLIFSFVAESHTRPKELQPPIDQDLAEKVNIPLMMVWFVQSACYSGSLPFIRQHLPKAKTTMLWMALCEIPGVFFVYIGTRKFGFKSTLACNLLMSCLICVCFGLFEWEKTVRIVLSCLFYFFHIPIWGLLFALTPLKYKSKEKMWSFHVIVKQIPVLLAPLLGARLTEDSSWFMFAWGILFGVGFLVSLLL
jgi:hypothetical protein